MPIQIVSKDGSIWKFEDTIGVITGSVNVTNTLTTTMDYDPVAGSATQSPPPSGLAIFGQDGATGSLTPFTITNGSLVVESPAGAGGLGSTFIFGEGTGIGVDTDGSSLLITGSVDIRTQPAWSGIGSSLLIGASGATAHVDTSGALKTTATATINFDPVAGSETQTPPESGLHIFGKDATTGSLAPFLIDGGSLVVSAAGNGGGLGSTFIFGEGTGIGVDTEGSQLLVAGSLTLIGGAVASFDVKNAIDTTTFDLSAAAYGSTTSIAADYILDNIEFNFSTSQSRDITVSTTDGTKIYEDTGNTNTHVSLGDINQAYNSGDNITIDVTQTGGACNMDALLKIREQAPTLAGSPVLGDSTADIGNVKIQDTNLKFTEFDINGVDTGADYGYLVGIDSEHHKIHEGKHFTCNDYDNDVDTGTPKLWLFKPGTGSDVHVLFTVTSSLNGTLEFFENAIASASGTALTAFNNDRESTTTSNAECFSDPTVSNSGTCLFVEVIGTDGAAPTGRAGGVISRNQEFILGQGSVYLLKFDALTNNNRVSMVTEHYEVDV